MKLKLTLQEAQLLVRHAILSGQITPAANAGYGALIEKHRQNNRKWARARRQRFYALGLRGDGKPHKPRKTNHPRWCGLNHRDYMRNWRQWKNQSKAL